MNDSRPLANAVNPLGLAQPHFNYKVSLSQTHRHVLYAGMAECTKGRGYLPRAISRPLALGLVG
jgi:hypothetical protein